ncbi:MAG: adenylosuccinate lyase [bacterium]|nr:adenylosuccinate lyase [bacterium]
MRNLEAISPIDGRYRTEVSELAAFFSESAQMKYRVTVECEYLIALSEHPHIGTRRFSEKEEGIIRQIYDDFDLKDAEILSAIEHSGYKNIKATDHDMKAIEYFMKDTLKFTSLKDSLEWIHFCLTSEDVSNLGYALMISDALEKVIILALEKILANIDVMAKTFRAIPILARTHGQSASPSTLGKELKIFAQRIERQLKQLKNIKLLVKLNGATGNYNAFIAAYPAVNWISFSENFIKKIGRGRMIRLEPNLLTTQIEPHDSYAEIFDIMRRINTILLNFNQDMWRYISDGWFSQKAVEGEIGSSAMPHKINPLKFENSEGNLGIADALIEFFSRKLPISRLQRDLSDSTVERNFGVAFAHSLIGYKYILKGLSRLTVNDKKIAEDLEKHPEVISEALQTILRREGMPFPYEKLKNLTRGRTVAMKDFEKFIDELEATNAVKKELKRIKPGNYIGLAKKLAILKLKKTI